MKNSERNLARIVLEGLLSGAIHNGVISSVGKSDRELAAELRSHLLRLSRNQSIPITQTIDHRSELLSRARRELRLQHFELACVFFATWFEHSINEIIHGLAMRRGMSSNVIDVLIRKTTLQDRATWVLELLGGTPFASKHLGPITRVSEIRNAFLHYKWKGVDPDMPDPGQAALDKLDETVSYVRRQARKHTAPLSSKRLNRILDAIGGGAE